MKLSRDNPIIRFTRWFILRTGLNQFVPAMFRYGGWLFLLTYRPLGFKSLLLTTTGRRSGLLRTSPVMYIKHGQDFVVAAHYVGHDRHPNWYFNLIANRKVTVEVFWKRHDCYAEPVQDQAERKALLELFPFGIAEAFQEHTKRTVPIIRLSPIVRGH